MGYKEADSVVRKFINECADKNVLRGHKYTDEVMEKTWDREGSALIWFPTEALKANCSVEKVATILLEHRRWHVHTLTVFRLALLDGTVTHVGFLEAMPATEEQEWYGIGHVEVEPVATWKPVTEGGN